MKTTVKNIKYTIYTFEDMEIYIIDDRETANVYKKSLDDDSKLIFVFGVELKNMKDLDIEQLHDNGYFDTEEEEGPMKKVEYWTGDREGGDFIDKFDTREAAEAEIKKYEEADRAFGTYTPNFYDVFEVEEEDEK